MLKKHMNPPHKEQENTEEADMTPYKQQHRDAPSALKLLHLLNPPLRDRKILITRLDIDP